jgi:hypothetical protein
MQLSFTFLFEALPFVSMSLMNIVYTSQTTLDYISNIAFQFLPKAEISSSPKLHKNHVQKLGYCFDL